MNGLRFTDDDRLLAGKSRDGHRHDDPMIVIAADSAAASAPSSGYGQLVLFLLCRHTQAGKTIRHGGKTVALLDAQSRRVIETAGALCTGCLEYSRCPLPAPSVPDRFLRRIFPAPERSDQDTRGSPQRRTAQ